MKLLTSRRAFTLIELMIVIAIIAILAAILVPNFVRARGQAQLTACKDNLKATATALEMYANDNYSNFPTVMGLNLVAPNYIREIPICPTAQTDTYTPGYMVDLPVHSAYTVVCLGSTHLGVLDFSDYPQYSSFSGLVLPK